MKRTVLPILIFLFSVVFVKAQEEVSVHSKGLDLYGTLLLPEAPTSKVVLLVSGAGKTDRDGNIWPEYKNDALKKLAIGLKGMGYATLRYDKRGVGKSVSTDTVKKSILFEEYVGDAINWIKYLKNNYDDITVIGHGQGSLVGMMAVKKIKVQRFVSLAGLSEDLHTTLKRQLSVQPASVKDSIFPILDSLKLGRPVTNVPHYLNVLIGPGVQDYVISFMKYDPRMEIRGVKIPILIVLGDRDVHESVASAKVLFGENQRASLKIIKNMNHVLRWIPEDRMENFDSYSQATSSLHTELLPALKVFLLKS